MSRVVADGAYGVLRAMGSHGIFRGCGKRWRWIVGSLLVGTIPFLVTAMTTVVRGAVVFLVENLHFGAQTAWGDDSVS